ncbi:glutathione synthase/RimK-type ligase-like ATP-grasp enzyme [Paenibacillus sp. DS2015]|uniref:YheC/YheD family protein n=1 Tax=Paenibacillus sp. DS2015 TaxID=3373917 RepID=UPI003D1B59FD
MKLSKNKWLKYKFMEESSSLASHLPRTQQFSYPSLQELINKYGQVVVKPIGGSRGRGVYQVRNLGGEHGYEVHIENKKLDFSSLDDAYSYLKNHISSSHNYMVQRLISRATVHGRPFDMRIIVQRRHHHTTWKVTGKVAKIAGKGYIVSNIGRSHGKLMLVRSALKESSLRHKSKTKLTNRIERVVLRTAKRMELLFPGHRIYGLDIGFDQDGYVWIIEANLFPSSSHFKMLKDKKMYRRISSYKHDH